MKIIYANEKHDTRTIRFTPENVLELFAERVEWYYDNWDDGDPDHQWADRAARILAARDHDAAWKFMLERRDHEYEYVELREVE